jgi:uncharacterized membrane protein
MTKNKSALILLVVVLAIGLQFCKSSQTASTTKDVPKVVLISYEKDIKPLMLERCTPCHFPETGQKKMLNTYAAAKESVNEMIRRVKLNPQDPQFMPFRSKRPALTEAEIKLFSDWLSQGTPN